MKVLVLLTLLLCCANTNELPIPPEFQHGGTMKVHMVDTQAEINKACGVAPAGMRFLGCAKDSHDITVFNPCSYPEAKDVNSFAHVMCHEKAHANGWVHGAPF